MLKQYKDLFNETEFKDAIRAKRVCLFLGSGVGFNIGMPDWIGLAKEIVKFCLTKKIISRSEKINLLTLDNPLKIISICIERIESKNKENDFNNLLKKIFITNPKKEYRKSSIYRNLNKLYKEKTVLLLQTNYDAMIEMFQSEKEAINRNSLIPYLNNGDIPNEKDILDSIVYLHGRFGDAKNDQYDNLVLDRKQYNDVYVLKNSVRYMKQKEFMEYLLSKFYIVFLGYSLNDVELLQMIANKPHTEHYKKISIIVDNCECKNLENEFNAKYLHFASNEKINTYVYDTEIVGIKKGFEKVIDDLTQLIFEISNQKSCLLKYTNPEEVDFD